MFVLGVGLQLAFLRPLRDEEREELSLLVTWAIALGIEGLLSVAYQTTYRSTITGYADRSWHVAGYYISVARGYAFVASLVVLGPALRDPPAHEARSGDPGDRPEPDCRPPARHRHANGLGRSALGSSVATASAAGAVYGIVFPFNPGSHYDLISRLLSISCSAASARWAAR